ncbi:shikimate kinase [Thalassobacillus pellis]|uniref:shikimate kinase n=1 Tax=Thalassobacillus pellis TaxID=748008 RepID=UPI001EF807F5|nr:shikimate kinase [Thalassobacillus pellis]MBM7552307.1 shikimate kinase [Thalassobacillus pellis]
MKTIFLIGFMGSGKTTVAEILSEKLSMKRLEMDEEIEKQQSMKIPEIFEQFGETHFRLLESELLQNIPETGLIVSTGGGVPMRNENRELLKKGTVVFLEADWEEIVQRLQGNSGRPLWNNSDAKAKKDLFDARQTVYKQTADVAVSVNGKSPETIADEITHVLK